jgi:hypothetical protein
MRLFFFLLSFCDLGRFNKSLPGFTIKIAITSTAAQTLSACTSQNFSVKNFKNHVRPKAARPKMGYIGSHRLKFLAKG